MPSLDCFADSNICINGCNNKLIIKKTCHIYDGLNIHMENKCDNRLIFIDENCSSNKGCHISCVGNGKQIKIGKDCMFGTTICIRTTDFHKVYDLEADKLLNEDRDVIIGNHVWTGNNVFICRGAVVPDGCVVGLKAFVNKEFKEENCILAGCPAKIVRKHIRWER